jgi:signal transduction histidine kinase
MSDATSGYVAFRPRARLLKLIGEELISDEVVAITELVKNSHDADASTVTVAFRNVTGPDGVIEIIDDGCGMDRETFLGGWMEPAGSTKATDAARVTGRGRRVLGEKGVGRFSVDKLGRNLELISLRKGHSGEVRATFDWDEFEEGTQMLSDVRHRWEIRPASEIKKHGTILRISGLRQAWSERMFRRLSTRLGRLQSPFGSQHGFTIRIESDEFPEYSGEVRSSFLDRAPYSIGLDFDGRDSFRVEICGRDLAARKKTEPAHPDAGQLSCGPVRIRLYAFDLETEAIAKVGPRVEIRGWLREWSGVSVYRDSFRIWPYGEPHDDWLRLDQRRVNNPVVRLSNNQIVGFVEISRDRNPELVDQTNREGLIHNDAFRDLRKIVEHALSLLEAERQRTRHPAGVKRSERRGRSTVSDPVVDALEKIATSARVDQRDLRRVVAEARASAERKQAELEHLIRAYNDLAAAGQAVIGIGGTLSPLVERLKEQLGAKKGATSNTARATLEEIEQHLAMLEAVAAPAPLRRRTMDVLAEIEVFRSAMAPLLESRGVRFTVTWEGNNIQRVDMHPHTFRRVLHILLANSFDWFLRTEDRRVSVHSHLLPDRCEITFSDTGPGIPRGVIDRVFEPLFTMKEGGRGMGLTIARGLVDDIGGTVTVLSDGRRRGAHVRVTLPRKRSRATPHVS